MLPAPNHFRGRDMYPEITLNLFGTVLILKSYALFTVLGALAGVIVAFPLLSREGIKLRRALVLIVLMAVAFFIGARMFNFAINPDAYGDSLHIYSMRLAGFSFYGGVLGALITLLLWAYLDKINAWLVLDALVIPAGLAFVLARVGCYLNGCCAGIATDSFLGVNFPVYSSNKILSGFFSFMGEQTLKARLFPTQLFELGFALLGLVPVLFLQSRKKLPTGGAFLLYGIWFSLMRLLILPLRSLPYPAAVAKIFYPAFYLVLILTGLYLLRRRCRKDVGEIHCKSLKSGQ